MITSADQRTGRPIEINLGGNRELERRMPLLDVCALLSVTCLVAAVALRRPEIMALGAPVLIAVAASLAMWRPLDGTVLLELDTNRVIEGDPVGISVEVGSARGLDRLEIEVTAGDRLVPTGPMRAVTTVRPGERVKLRFELIADEWGVAAIEELSIRVTDRLGMFGGRIRVKPGQSVRIGLPEDRIADSLEADRFHRIVGSHLSNDRGDGLEIADIRPFQPGDSTRQINWRISNRRQEPWVTLRHPDRSSTVIVIVDAHDGEDDDQRATQRRSVGAAMALARGHLAMHDRVGLLVVGHTLKWLPPKLGRNQLYGIADQLVAVGNAPEASRRMYRPPAVSIIPDDAIVVAISPLRDPLMVSLAAEIRSHGNPVSVLVPAAEPAKRRRIRSSTRTDDQARRLAAVEQRLGVQSLRERGVGIVPWGPDDSVLTVIASAQRLRRSMARSRSW